MRIGEKLKEYRISHQIKQEVLARRLGVTASTLSNWEAGRRIPDISSLRQISETIGMNYNELLSDEDYRIYTETVPTVQEEVHKKAEAVLYTALTAVSVMRLLFLLSLYGSESAMNPMKAGDLLVPLVAVIGTVLALKGKSVPKISGIVFFCFVLSGISLYLDPQYRAAVMNHYASLDGLKRYATLLTDGLTVLTAVFVLYEFLVPGEKRRFITFSSVLIVICGMLYLFRCIRIIRADLAELALLQNNAFLQWPAKAYIFTQITELFQILLILSLVLFEQYVLEKKRGKNVINGERSNERK